MVITSPSFAQILSLSVEKNLSPKVSWLRETFGIDDVVRKRYPRVWSPWPGVHRLAIHASVAENVKPCSVDQTSFRRFPDAAIWCIEHTLWPKATKTLSECGLMFERAHKRLVPNTDESSVPVNDRSFAT